MPYLIHSTLRNEDAFEKSFEPALPARTQLQIALAKHLSEAEREGLSRTVLVKSRGLELPDIMGWLMGPWLLAPHVRERLEELEPGVHEFVAVNVKTVEKPNEEAFPYNLLLLTQSIDAIDLDKTNFMKGFGAEAAKMSLYLFNYLGPCTLYRDQVHGKHLWRGAGKMDLRYFCSDEFGEYLMTHKARGWDLLKCDLT